MSDSTSPTHDKDNAGAKLQSFAASLSNNREAPLPPALSACNKNTQKSLPSNINWTEETAAKSAPNQLVKWNELKDLLDENLGPCGICQNTDRHLVEQKSICYATPIAIHCPVCEKKKLQKYNSVQYKAAKLKEMRRTTAQEKKDYCKARLALNHEQRQLQKRSAACTSSSLTA